MKWVISVGAGRQQLPAIRKCQSLGFKVLGLDRDTSAAASAVVDDFCAVDIINREACLDAVKTKGYNFVAAASFVGEAGMRTTGYLVDQLKISGIGENLAVKMTDKFIQMESFRHAGIGVPRSYLVRDWDECVLATKELRYPLIFKPVDAAGSRGVFKIEVDDVKASGKFIESKSASKSGQVLVQEFIAGQEYSVEGLWVKGNFYLLAISKRKVLFSTTAQEIYTDNLPANLVEKIRSSVERAHRALGYCDGLSHTELFVTECEDVILLETAGRGGGFLVFDGLVPAVTGVDVNEYYLRNLLGLELNIPDLAQKYHAILHFISARQGIVESIRGFEAIKGLEGVHAEPFVSVGARTSNPRADADRLGYILARAESPEKARALLSRAQELISFEIGGPDESHRHASASQH